MTTGVLREGREILEHLEVQWHREEVRSNHGCHEYYHGIDPDQHLNEWVEWGNHDRDRERFRWGMNVDRLVEASSVDRECRQTNEVTSRGSE